MQTYKIKHKQNIYDISTYLFGTIEGVFELMASNPNLSFDTELNVGDELYWDDKSIILQSIVDEMNEQGFVPCNSERHVYYKKTDKRLRFKIHIPSDSMCISFMMSGNNGVVVDWGDDSPLEEIVLQTIEKEYVHYFDNKTSSRVISLYGEFEIKFWDMSTITNGKLYPVSPVIVDEIKSTKNNISLDGLFLFKGTYKVELSDMVIQSLDCIYDMSLSDLTLTKNEYIKKSSIDDYLIYIAKNHNQRRNCHVVIDKKPSGSYEEPPKDEFGNYIITTGMQAVYVIIHEKSWNEAGPWIFDICGVRYSADNLSFDHKLTMILE